MKRLLTIVLLAMAALCTVSLVGCSSPDDKADASLSDRVAATVNGTDIYESQITAYIEDFRSRNASLQDDEGWAQALANESLTPQTYRNQVIESFVQSLLIKQEAEKLGLRADSTQIEQKVSKARANFTSEQTWLSALSTSGFASEDDYRAYLELSSLNARLKEAVTQEASPTEAQIQEKANETAASYQGKRSSHILFRITDVSEAEAVTATAEAVLAQVEGGADFASLARQYSEDTASAQNGGDVSWDSLNTFIDEYQLALDTLATGQVYPGIVQTGYGLHIIKCTGEYIVGDSGAVDMSAMPAEIKAAIVTALKADLRDEEYTAYLVKLRQGADVVVYDMPEGLSYAVDMTVTLGETDAADTSDAAGAADASPSTSLLDSSSDVSGAGGAAGNTSDASAPANGTAAVNENH